MIVLDYSNPKVSITEFTSFLSDYLGANFDGITQDGTKLTVVTFESIPAVDEEYIKSYFYSMTGVSQQIVLSPFSAKSIEAGKIYRRLHGVTATLLANGATTVEFVIPYTQCKINRIHLVWFPESITCDFNIYDTPTGTLSTIPNYKLNQFAFGAAIGKDFHEDYSEYDADLIKDMKIEVILHNPTNVTKEIAINFVLHEIKQG